jgi:hypothetical protein
LGKRDFGTGCRKQGKILQKRDRAGKMTKEKNREEFFGTGNHSWFATLLLMRDTNEIEIKT